MAIYNTPPPSPQVDVFARPDGPLPPPSPPPGRRGLHPLAAMVMIILVFGVVGGIGVAVFFFKPQVNLGTPLEESVPFQRTASYFASYDEIVAMTGPKPKVRDVGDSRLDWSVTGAGEAVIHLQLAGPEGEAEGWSTWKKDADGWGLKAASFLSASGEQVAIPTGGGGFLSRYDLAAWRAADPLTSLGRGQRELIEGRPVQAIQDLTAVIKEDPQNADALLWRGRAFERLGNVPKALADYQRILVFEPDNAAALARLDGLRASPPLGEAVSPRPDAAKPPSHGARPSSLIPD
ncbi:MAG: hypothetical protein EA397_08165 [Deltaproteobacteria bacterium]|nr:MAG: hypothetical protein EA397_08165 [Deltaproteobacteria bacterium]